MPNKGFTLIEVLLALAIVAIALTALLTTSAQQTRDIIRLKEKTIGHWVSMQAVSLLQLNLLPQATRGRSTQVTKWLGERWYWRASAEKTPFPFVEKIVITRSHTPAGTFADPVIAFRYHHE